MRIAKVLLGLLSVGALFLSASSSADADPPPGPSPSVMERPEVQLQANKSRILFGQETPVLLPVLALSGRITESVVTQGELPTGEPVVVALLGCEEIDFSVAPEDPIMQDRGFRADQLRVQATNTRSLMLWLRFPFLVTIRT